jgi:hypothetical protein
MKQKNLKIFAKAISLKLWCIFSHQIIQRNYVKGSRQGFDERLQRLRKSVSAGRPHRQAGHRLAAEQTVEGRTGKQKEKADGCSRRRKGNH